MWSFVCKLGPPSWTRSLSRTSWSRLLLPPCYSSLLSLGLHLGTTFTFFILFGFLVRFLFFLRGFAGSKPQPPPLILHTLPGSNYHFYRWYHFYRPLPEHCFYRNFLPSATPIIKHGDSHLQGYPEISGGAFTAWRSISAQGLSSETHLLHLWQMAPLSTELSTPEAWCCCQWSWGQRWRLVYFTVTHQDVLDRFLVQDGNLSLHTKLHTFLTTLAKGKPKSSLQRAQGWPAKEWRVSNTQQHKYLLKEWMQLITEFFGFQFIFFSSSSFLSSIVSSSVKITIIVCLAYCHSLPASSPASPNPFSPGYSHLSSSQISSYPLNLRPFKIKSKFLNMTYKSIIPLTLYTAFLLLGRITQVSL